MAGPITWKNVAAPDFGDAIRARQQAARGMDDTFDNLQGIVKQRDATEAANWQQGSKNNTAAFLASVRKPQNAEEYAALKASGALDNQLSGYGAQINQEAAAAAMDGRLATLQNRGLNTMLYGDKVRDNREAPLKDAIGAAIARNDVAGARTLMDAGDYRGEAVLEAALADRQRGMVKEVQDKAIFNQNVERFGFDRAKAMHEEAMRPGEIVAQSDRSMAAAQAILSSQASIRSSDASAAASRASAANYGTQNNIGLMKLEDARKERDAQKLLTKNATILKDTTYADGLYSNSDAPGLLEMMTKAGIGDDQGERANILSRLTSLADKGIPVSTVVNGKTTTTNVPLSRSQVKAALLSIKDEKFNLFSYGDGWANNLESALKKAAGTTTTEAGPDGKLVPVNKTVRDYQLYQELQRSAIENPTAGKGGSALDAALSAAKKKVK